AAPGPRRGALLLERAGAGLVARWPRRRPHSAAERRSGARALSGHSAARPSARLSVPAIVVRRRAARAARLAAALRGRAAGRSSTLRPRRPQRLPGHDRVPASHAARSRVLSPDPATPGPDGGGVLGGGRARLLLLDHRSQSRR